MAAVAEGLQKGSFSFTDVLSFHGRSRRDERKRKGEKEEGTFAIIFFYTKPQGARLITGGGGGGPLLTRGPKSSAEVAGVLLGVLTLRGPDGALWTRAL